MNNGETLLKVEHLCQYFGRNKAVDDVSFEVKKGEVFGLVGESGCGKTTTGRSIIKLYDITSGDIFYKGERIAAGTMSYREEIKNAKEEYKAAKKAGTDSAKLAEIKADTDARIAKAKEGIKAAKADHKKHKTVTDIQMIFQDPIASLDPRMTVGQIIAEGLVINGEKDKKKIDEKVYEALEMVGLVREHAGRYPHEFSGGQRQRLLISRAIAGNPEILILDDSSSALDYKTDANLRAALSKDIPDSTVITVAQRVSSVKNCDLILVIENGEIIGCGKHEHLLETCSEYKEISDSQMGGAFLD